MNILEQNSQKINGVLQTFDRMIINGYLLNLCNHRQFLFYLIQRGIKLKDFNVFASNETEKLCHHIKAYSKKEHLDIIHLNSGKINKDQIAKKQLDTHPHKHGLIAILSAVEVCNTTTVKPNKALKQLQVTTRSTRCKHYYFYYNDQEFGWMFLKIQTWFPYNVQIYINGREYLSKLLDQHKIGYQMYYNSFSYIQDYDKAQALANRMLSTKISDSFDGMIGKINCLLPTIESVFSHTYYWCLDQCEFATDINFKNREDLNLLYKPLVEATYFAFSSEDIYSFFGRKIAHIQKTKHCEIVSDLRHRHQGYRIKFKINSNQIKMYDKGTNLRIEVTINNPKDFKVMKEVERVDSETQEIKKEKVWRPMGKSIANLYRYADISQSIIKRYIEALPEIEMDKPPIKEITQLSSRKEVKNRTYSGFNILNEETLKLFQTIAKGEYLINGFTNKMIRKHLFEDSETTSNINRMTRLLAKLKAHGVIKKVAKKNKYYLTTNGRRMITSILLYSRKSLLN